MESASIENRDIFQCTKVLPFIGLCNIFIILRPPDCPLISLTQKCLVASNYSKLFTRICQNIFLLQFVKQFKNFARGLYGKWDGRQISVRKKNYLYHYREFLIHFLIFKSLTYYRIDLRISQI